VRMEFANECLPVAKNLTKICEDGTGLL
jgi:hypothetical protein